jgi:hypothetical protein
VVSLGGVVRGVGVVLPGDAHPAPRNGLPPLTISGFYVDAGDFTVSVDVDEELNRVAADLAVFVVVLTACGNVDFGTKGRIAVRAGDVTVG